MYMMHIVRPIYRLHSKYVFIEHEHLINFYSFIAYVCQCAIWIAHICINWHRSHNLRSSSVKRKCNKFHFVNALLETLSKIEKLLYNMVSHVWWILCVCVLRLRLKYFTQYLATNQLTQAIYCSMHIYFNWAVDEHCANTPAHTWKHSLLLAGKIGLNSFFLSSTLGIYLGHVFKPILYFFFRLLMLGLTGSSLLVTREIYTHEHIDQVQWLW